MRTEAREAGAKINGFLFGCDFFAGSDITSHSSGTGWRSLLLSNPNGKPRLLSTIAWNPRAFTYDVCSHLWKRRSLHPNVQFAHVWFPVSRKSSAQGWSCPVCNKRVRPEELLIDGVETKIFISCDMCDTTGGVRFTEIHQRDRFRGRHPPKDRGTPLGPGMVLDYPYFVYLAIYSITIPESKARGSVNMIDFMIYSTRCCAKHLRRMFLHVCRLKEF